MQHVDAVSSTLLMLTLHRPRVMTVPPHDRRTMQLRRVFDLEAMTAGIAGPDGRMLAQTLRSRNTNSTRT
jgi:hypothetical protein